MKALLCHFPLRDRAAVLLLGAVLICLASCHKTDPDVTEILGAAGKGDLRKTQLLLNHNPNLAFSKNSEGFTALHYAASYGYMEIADLLLAKNADVNAKTGKGETPLHYAASYGYKDIAELLLSNKASIDVRDGIGCTPLYFAATNGRIEEVRMLLAAQGRREREDVSRLYRTERGSISRSGGYCPFADQQRSQR